MSLTNYLLIIFLSGFIGIGCGKDDGEVSVKAEPAVAGETGPAGEDGKDGVDGTGGLPDGNAQSAQNELINAWIDPITGLKWLIGGKGQFAALPIYCTGDYNAPDHQTLLTAAMHGLFVVSKDLGGMETGWTTEVVSATNGAIVDLSLSTYWNSVSKGVNHGIFCYTEIEE